MELDGDNLRRKNGDLMAAYNEKLRSLTRTQKEHDTLKRRVLQSDVQLAAQDAVEQTLHSAASAHLVEHGEFRQRGADSHYRQLPFTQRGMEQIHKFQRSGSGSPEGTGKRNLQTGRNSYDRTWDDAGKLFANPRTPFFRLDTDRGQLVYRA